MHERVLWSAGSFSRDHEPAERESNPSGGNELAHEEHTGKTEKYAPAAYTFSTGAGFSERDHEPAERESNPSRRII